MIRGMMCPKITKIGDTEVKNATFEEATKLLKKYTDVKDDDIIFCFLNNWGYYEICRCDCEFANTCRKLRRVTETKTKIYGEMQWNI